MEVSNPRDDRAERNRGSAEVPLSTVIPRVGNFHLEKNTILDSFSCTTTTPPPPQIWFISRFCVIFFGALSLGENTWVRCNFITQAKSVAISVWCARNLRIKPTPRQESLLKKCAGIRIILGHGSIRIRSATDQAKASDPSTTLSLP